MNQMKNLILVITCFFHALASSADQFISGIMQGVTPSSTCNAANYNKVRFNDTTNAMEYCKASNSTWTAVGTSGGAGGGGGGSVTFPDFTDLTNQQWGAGVWSNWVLTSGTGTFSLDTTITGAGCSVWQTATSYGTYTAIRRSQQVSNFASLYFCRWQVISHVHSRLLLAVILKHSLQRHTQYKM